MKIDLSTKIGSLTLKNPIMVASGTFGYGEEFNKNFYKIKELGAVVAKGISKDPWQGNDMPRIVETPSGMINAIGLQNVGLENFIKEKLPYLKKTAAKIIVNVLGKTVDEYVEVSEALNDEDGVDAIELNISCPNVKHGGIQFGTNAKEAEKVTKAVRKECKKPIIVKLSPNVTDITEIGLAVEGAGADAVSAINTITAMAVDITKRKPVLANIVGGLSGPAIKPVALRMVWQLCQKLKIPVIGIGGISSINDVIEFLFVGASAVQIGTANYIDPMVANRLIGELEDYCVNSGVKSVKELIGKLEL